MKCVASGLQCSALTVPTCNSRRYPCPGPSFIALHSQRADVAAEVETLVQIDPYMPRSVHACPGLGFRPFSYWASLWARLPILDAQLLT